jgi:hypothetical protein
MRHYVIKRVALALALAVGVGGCTVGDADVIMFSVPAVGVSGGPAKVTVPAPNPECSPKYTYADLVNDGQAWQAVDRAQDQNTTQNSISIQFSSSSATTITTSASIELSASLKAVFASVQAKINASVSRAVSTEVGNEVSVTVPAAMTANGIYGVKVQVTTGSLYINSTCGDKTYKNVRTYVPIAPGWCVWISGQTSCRVVQ